MIELYRKNIWNDQKTVNVIATACLTKTTKVWDSCKFNHSVYIQLTFFFFFFISQIMVTALQFFMGSDEKQEDSDSDEEVYCPSAFYLPLI